MSSSCGRGCIKLPLHSRPWRLSNFFEMCSRSFFHHGLVLPKRSVGAGDAHDKRSCFRPLLVVFRLGVDTGSELISLCRFFAVCMFHGAWLSHLQIHVVWRLEAYRVGFVCRYRVGFVAMRKCACVDVLSCHALIMSYSMPCSSPHS